jgi:hypothetical protein
LPTTLFLLCPLATWSLPLPGRPQATSLPGVLSLTSGLAQTPPQSRVFPHACLMQQSRTLFALSSM